MKKKLMAFLLTTVMGIAAIAPVTTQTAHASDSLLGENMGTVKLDKYGRYKISRATLHDQDEVHYYSFTPKTAGTLKLVVNPSSTPYSRVVEKYTEEALTSWNTDYNHRELTLEYNLSKGATYLIEISNYRGVFTTSPNPYSGSITFSAAKESFPEDFPVQAKESKETAKNVSLNKTYYGFNGLGNDIDWYKVKVISTGTMIQSGSANWDLYNSKGESIYCYNGKELSKGTYYLKVSGNGKGAYSFRFNDAKAARPKATSIKKLSKGKKSFKVNVKKVSAKGYQVQYSRYSNFKGSKTKTFKSTSCTIKGLKAKKKYYVRVRAYNNFDGDRVYSSWSSKKAIKVK